MSQLSTESKGVYVAYIKNQENAIVNDSIKGDVMHENKSYF